MSPSAGVKRDSSLSLTPSPAVDLNAPETRSVASRSNALLHAASTFVNRTRAVSMPSATLVTDALSVVAYLDSAVIRSLGAKLKAVMSVRSSIHSNPL